MPNDEIRLLLNRVLDELTSIRNTVNTVLIDQNAIRSEQVKLNDVQSKISERQSDLHSRFEKMQGRIVPFESIIKYSWIGVGVATSAIIGAIALNSGWFIWVAIITAVKTSIGLKP